MIKSKVPLKLVKGTYCDDDDFYNLMEFRGYDIKKMIKDVKNKDTIDPIIVIDLEKVYRTWSSKDDNYKYAVQEGSEILKIVKDIIKKEGNFKTALIEVHIIDDFKKYREENESEKLL